jgi:hypothetical protein
MYKDSASYLLGMYFELICTATPRLPTWGKDRKDGVNIHCSKRRQTSLSYNILQDT